MTSSTTIQLRHDTATNWALDNPTLAAGEMGVETDTNKFKFGDGATAWNSLAYAGGSASTFKYGLYTLSGNQTSNLATNNHVEFNTSQGSLGGLSTGSGQANGIVTLTGGKTYKITGAFRCNHSSAGATNICIYNRTSSAYVGTTAALQSMNANSLYSMQPTLLAFVSPESNIDVEARICGTSYTSAVSEVSWILIEEYGGY